MKIFFSCLIIKIYRKFKSLIASCYERELGYRGKNVMLGIPASCSSLKRMYLYDNTNIFDGFRFISYTGKFIMKENSGAAEGLTIITGNHHRVVGEFIKETIQKRSEDIEQDIIVHEDVWIGANVILMEGCHVGRGANIGAGSVVRFKIPPYAVVIGNPAKIVGFSYSPEEVKEHELKMYAPNDRIDICEYEKVYQKFYIDNIKQIQSYLKFRP
ncbi:galactoside O-acetyltransferase [Candidatus Bacteroides intestinigallinarum]|jgi:acetyltransferase-like isoleucine patch superfamily enzyme|uniref:galactoside O-acetyltransferase n=1 Tax=Bacteroides TaxID=816 RepID=UPI000E812085|nr:MULTISPECIES: galactoside O-acetyltransferase [Bacteroides]MCS3177396.1 galactoside O-acetyltransferase [Candidatus Bacteroides intestinigallinarum]RGN60784.1 galactoside O-acetyltransferase [Bacteroides sp. OM05-10AA]RGQ65184.1 galactoside O-acetyltransferase [Bacteroides sp. AF27-33]